MKLELNITEELNGKKPFMGVALIDSYGDKELRELTLGDIDPINPNSEHFDNYFVMCSNCRVAVLKSNFTLGSDVCDHCYKAGPSLEGFATMKDRIGAATFMASTVFWRTIAELFPECNFDEQTSHDFEQASIDTVTRWVELNTPVVARKPEDWTRELNLHYPLDWTMEHTVARTKSVVVNMRHVYLGVDCGIVAVYEDKQDGKLFENELCCWNFNANPAVLMNMLEQELSGHALYDLNLLFDDIYTVSKSGMVS